MATSEKNVADLTVDSVVKSIDNKPADATNSETPCAANDPACTKRWIDSFSDCV